MTLHYNRHIDREKRRALRNNSTIAEQRLWRALRRSQLGHRFRRQYGVDGFVLDFYCPRLRLGIEVDGDSHFTDEALAYDQARTDFLSCFGIKILRFTNLEVRSNLEGVLHTIREEVENRATSP